VFPGRPPRVVGAHAGRPSPDPNDMSTPDAITPEPRPTARRFFKTSLVLALAALLHSQARCSEIDVLIERLDRVGAGEQLEKIEKTEKPPAITTYRLGDCIDSAMQANKKLIEKRSGTDAIQGQKLVDLARFRTHLEFAGAFNRQKGSMLKSFYPALNPPTSISSAGGVDVGGLQLESLSASDIESLTGMSAAELSSLASQFGIDVSQFGLRRAPLPQDRTNPAGRTAQAQVCVDITPVQQACVEFDEQAIASAVASSLSSSLFGISQPSEEPVSESEFSYRLSRRLFEFGKDAASSVTVRTNMRTAIYNYEQTYREIASAVRKNFFLVLLKKDQIKTRHALLAEYEEKWEKLQKRFEIAKDVPRIDVYTAELDVLNEKLRINALETDLAVLKMELLQLMGRPIAAEFVEFEGEFQPFDYTLDEIVEITKNNSYQLAYLSGELSEEEREYREIAWDYRPDLTGKIGIENKRTALGLSLNKSGGTYGVDLGVEQFLNLPSPPLSSTGSENHFDVEFNLNYPFHRGSEKRGIRKQQLESLNQARARLADQDEQLELTARKAYQEYLEALERVRLQGETVNISKRRLEITRVLREHGKVPEFQLDSFRNTFFLDQDRYFTEQENVIVAQENLRLVMGVFD
ncbi:MAG: TolC family protein, partial [bacterium]